MSDRHRVDRRGTKDTKDMNVSANEIANGKKRSSAFERWRTTIRLRIWQKFRQSRHQAAPRVHPVHFIRTRCSIRITSRLIYLDRIAMTAPGRISLKSHQKRQSCRNSWTISITKISSRINAWCAKKSCRVEVHCKCIIVCILESVLSGESFLLFFLWNWVFLLEHSKDYKILLCPKNEALSCK